QALELQAAHHLGRRPRSLARPRPAQRGDGRNVPGRVPQLPQDPPEQVAEARLLVDRLWAALHDVQDPEMPINLVDLGVIYGITERDGVVDVDLTFTAMGCPASDFIVDDVRERLLQEPGVEEVRINVVWDPPWTTARMTEAGRDALEEWGLAVRLERPVPEAPCIFAASTAGRVRR